LDQAEQMLAAWQAGRSHRLHLKGEWNRATVVQNEAFKVAYGEMMNLRKTIRNRFHGNTPILTKFDLMPRHASTLAAGETVNGQPEAGTAGTPDNQSNSSSTNQTDTNPPADGNGVNGSNGATNGSGTSPKRKTNSRSLAAYLAHWRRVYTNTGTLSEAEQAILTKARWSPQRIAGAATLVETAADTDADQQMHEQAYNVQCARVRVQEVELRRWYSDVTGPLKLAIEQLDEAEQRRYKGAFDL
jgi:hypothetical protein